MTFLFQQPFPHPRYISELFLPYVEFILSLIVGVSVVYSIGIFVKVIYLECTTCNHYIH